MYRILLRSLAVTSVSVLLLSFIPLQLCFSAAGRSPEKIKYEKKRLIGRSEKSIGQGSEEVTNNTLRGAGLSWWCVRKRGAFLVQSVAQSNAY